MPIDAPPCVPGYIDLCKTTARTEMFTPTANADIDTSTDPRCQVKTQTGGPDLCVLYFTKVDIPTSVRLDVRGSRALVLASTTTLSIGGTLDASSHRAQGTGARGPASNHTTCVFAANPEADGGGGGGGSGGTFAIQGGIGGVGDENDSNGQGGMANGGTPGTAVAEPPLVLRGGCPGQKGGDSVGGGGGGANSGGAVYLFAKGNLAVGGRVQATGAGGAFGGNRAGGGGGGYGGYIVIESETQSSITGMLLATGGGGGEGGGNGVGGPADPGDDPTSANAAVGGARLNDGGNGGAGATYLNNNVVAPGTGQQSDGGGGGGGGGNGFIYVRGMGRMLNGTAAPLPIQPLI